MIETRTICGSCVTREHMCGGDCDCVCDTARTFEEIAELNWSTFDEEER